MKLEGELNPELFLTQSPSAQFWALLHTDSLTIDFYKAWYNFSAGLGWEYLTSF